MAGSCASRDRTSRTFGRPRRCCRWKTISASSGRCPLRRASVVIFNEALVHGTFPWQPADRIRRSVLFKYSPGFLAWDKTPLCPIDDPTPEESGLFEPTYRNRETDLGRSK